MKHPQQPIVDGSFHQNEIVRYIYKVLYQSQGIGMNELAQLDFSEDDWRQFRQLIGYTVTGYRELGHMEPLEEP